MRYPRGGFDIIMFMCVCAREPRARGVGSKIVIVLLGGIGWIVAFCFAQFV